jgi:hypothetical protein
MEAKKVVMAVVLAGAIQISGGFGERVLQKDQAVVIKKDAPLVIGEAKMLKGKFSLLLLQELKEKVKKLITQLDEEDFKKRESAEMLLEELGRKHPELVVDILQKKLKERLSQEALWRLQRILNVLTKDRWEELPQAPIEKRCYHTAIWTGKEMIIWGGGGHGSKCFADGASLRPSVR